MGGQKYPIVFHSAQVHIHSLSILLVSNKEPATKQLMPIYARQEVSYVPGVGAAYRLYIIDKNDSSASVQLRRLIPALEVTIPYGALPSDLE